MDPSPSIRSPSRLPSPVCVSRLAGEAGLLQKARDRLLSFQYLGGYFLFFFERKDFRSWSYKTSGTYHKTGKVRAIDLSTWQ